MLLILPLTWTVSRPPFSLIRVSVSACCHCLHVIAQFKSPTNEAMCLRTSEQMSVVVMIVTRKKEIKFLIFFSFHYRVYVSDTVRFGRFLIFICLMVLGNSKVWTDFKLYSSILSRNGGSSGITIRFSKYARISTLSV